MKVVINGSEADYPYIFVNGVQMPATFIARPANPRVDMGRRIIIEPALPEGGNTLLTADYLDFEINEVVISDNPSAYTPADVLKLLNEGYESPTGDDFPGIGSGLYSGGGGGLLKFPTGRSPQPSWPTVPWLRIRSKLKP